MTTAGSGETKFRRVFDEHFDAINRYCLRRLPREDANDAVAQVFVVAWRKVDQMPKREGTLPWLYRIACFEVSTMRRSGRRRHALRSRLNGLAPDEQAGPEAVVVRRAEHEAIATTTISRSLRSLRYSTAAPTPPNSAFPVR